MKPYLDLLSHLVTTGRRSANRTKTDTVKDVGAMIRIDLAEGFPALTTKKLYFKSAVDENLWFIAGDTNNETLRLNGTRIWNEWALEEDDTVEVPIPYSERMRLLEEKWSAEGVLDKDVSANDRLARQYDAYRANYNRRIIKGNQKTAHEFNVQVIDENEIPATYREVKLPKGYLGPLYGQQWRRFPAGDFFTTMTPTELRAYVEAMAPDQKAQIDADRLVEWDEIFDDEHAVRDLTRRLTDIGIDQISYALYLLKTEPNSRRIIVTSWNPQVVPGTALSPQDNVRRGRAALAACHTFFQLSTFELSPDERLKLFQAKREASDMEALLLMDDAPSFLDQMRIPKYQLNLTFYCRSQDVFLGTPFNLMGYALLTHMFAAQMNMVPGILTWMGGDVHVYTNHLEQAELQLSREPRALPKLWINPEVKSLFEYTPADFKLEGYDPHPPIKATVAV